VAPATSNTTSLNLETSSADSPATALKSANAFSKAIALLADLTNSSLTTRNAPLSNWYAP
jgi:hypothetical protein